MLSHFSLALGHYGMKGVNSMPIRVPKPPRDRYPDIQRGTSLTIPVYLQDKTSQPIDVSDYTISFTIKKVKSDFDWQDEIAYVRKDFDPQEPTLGRWYIELSSHDLYFEPDKYYFDIELCHKTDGSVTRLGTWYFDLIGGPTNRTVNNNLGQRAYGEEILVVHIDNGAPIINIVPFAFNQGRTDAEITDMIIQVLQDQGLI